MTDIDEDDFSDLDDLLDEQDPEDEGSALIDLDSEEGEEEEADRSIPLTRLSATGEVVSRGEESVVVSRNAASTDCEEVRRPLMSGHCNFPQTAKPEVSHQRCQMNGHGNRANPDRIFQPCPCRCHFPEEEYECECGSTIVAAPHYPVDEDGDTRYVHLDPKTGRVVDEECPR